MRFPLLLRLLFVLLGAGCAAPEPEGDPEAAEPIGEQVEVDYFTEAEKRAIGDTAQALLRRLYQAWNEGRYEEGFDLYENPTGLFGSEVMQSWEKRMEQEQKNLAALERFSQQLDTVIVQAVSPEVAVVIGKDHYEAVSTGGQQQKGSSTFTLVLAQREAGWRIVHFHVVTP